MGYFLPLLLEMYPLSLSDLPLPINFLSPSRLMSLQAELVLRVNRRGVFQDLRPRKAGLHLDKLESSVSHAHMGWRGQWHLP